MITMGSLAIILNFLSPQLIQSHLKKHLVSPDLFVQIAWLCLSSLSLQADKRFRRNDGYIYACLVNCHLARSLRGLSTGGGFWGPC